jgi:predicted TPR repeat methyltransferase
MIHKARERRCYDSLEEVELTEFLQVIPAGSFDVIAAVDVFSYVGAIDRVVEHAWRALRVDGLLAFTVEAGDGDYELDSSGRYRHGKRYLDRVRERANYRDVSCSRQPIRSEAGLPCDGLVTVWRRGPSEGSITSSLER